MKIKARFIGTEGSLGLKKGKLYRLEVKELNIWNSFWEGYKIEVTIDKIIFWCPYKNLETFLQNWDDIRICR